MTYTIGYTLRSTIDHGALTEEIKVSSSITEEKDLPVELEKLRALAFHASHSDRLYEEIKGRTAKADLDLMDSQRALKKMQQEWNKATEFLKAQGLKEAIPDFPIREAHHYENPKKLASTQISGVEMDL
ncbi:hypothetical protein [Picosynechococcus sp. PCC 8807]|uniref:hypothetical protein n=1 Tax=Picosynechococcus sp. PCC 8807 TaxID=195248 RepID=UPI000810DBAC|nr:hypothetical protein [Picosynechococcus sp. PCC 8807]ANV90884.1 hypothetical protein AWQ24_09700 [Picosynechococcus sp. PCC 8807]